MTSLRRAVVDDISELIRLRKLMHASMSSKGLDDPAWQAKATHMLRLELARADADIAAYVVEAGGGMLAACATGIVQLRLPSPSNPSGRLGYVFNVSTDPAYRRRGYSRACMEALLEWFRARRVRRVELRASEAGEPLYRSLGFQRTADPSMRLVFEPSPV